MSRSNRKAKVGQPASVLVHDYFANERQFRDHLPWTTEADDRFDRVHAGVDDLVRSDPERLWPILLELVEQAPDEEALAFLAAGPLEDLIQYHSDAFVDRLLDQTRKNPRFRRAMQGVWGWERVPAEIADRIRRLL